MKKLILLMMFAFGMLLAMPEQQAQAAPDDGVVLNVDQGTLLAYANIDVAADDTSASVEEDSGGVVGDTVIAETEDADSGGVGTWDYIKANWGVIATILFFLSELLADIPALKGNSLFQTLRNLLKKASVKT